MTLFLKNVELFKKKSQENDKKSPPRALRREFAYRHRFRVETAIFRGFSVKNSDFGHFWGIFRVKNSIFTIFRCKTGKENRYQRIPSSLGILKRYHIHRLTLRTSHFKEENNA